MEPLETNPPEPTPVGPPPPGTWFSGLDPDKLAATIAEVQAKAPERIAESNGDIYFALFMLYIDRRVMKLAGVRSSDLADYQFRDAYDNGMTPRDVARDLLQQEGFFDE